MSIRLNARLITTARALARWQPDDLARRSGVPEMIIEGIELKTDRAPHSVADNDALVAAFEDAGVEFGEENGTPAVKFRTRRTEPIAAEPAGRKAQRLDRRVGQLAY